MLIFSDRKNLLAVLAEAGTGDGSFRLVKKHGIYLVAGLPGFDSQHRVYADGCHPERDDSWAETVRELTGGNAETEILSTGDTLHARILFTQISQERKQLRIILAFQFIRILTSRPAAVRVAEYRDLTDRMQVMAGAHFNACIGQKELQVWFGMAERLVHQAAFTSCARARPEDHQCFSQAFRALSQRLNCVSPDGALEMLH